MSLIVKTLRGKQIDDVLVDSELVYIMLTDGTQITIRGLVVVQPRITPQVEPRPASPSQLSV
jgi:hypothetical protein